MVEQVGARLFDFDVTHQRCHYRLVDTLGAEFFDHLSSKLREHHRRRDYRMPIAEYQRMNARILESQRDCIAVGGRRFATCDIDRISRRAKSWNEFSEGRVEVSPHRHQL